MSATLLAEYYEDTSAPHEALGRAARRLSSGGAVYLGGGIGIEKLRKGDAETYSVTKGGGKAEAFAGPLSAVVRGMTLAGGSTAPDSPGGGTKITDPAVVARLRELADREREAQQDIDRYTRRLATKPKTGIFPTAPGLDTPDPWEQRRINELNVELAQLRAERAKLLSSGKVEEAAEVGKPGTNWKQVTPAHRKKINSIVEFYRKKPHPFAACVRDNRKRFGDRAERVCAVVKDMGERTTKWRKGGRGKVSEEVEAFVDAALGRLAVVEDEFGLVALVQLAEGVDSPVPAVRALSESVTDDFALLALAGHPLGEAVFGIEEAFRTELHPHLPKGTPGAGEFRKVLGVHGAARRATSGGGTERPGGSGRSSRPTPRAHRSSVVKTRTNMRGEPRAPGAGVEREPAPKGARPRKLTEEQLPGAVGQGRWSSAAAAAVDGLHKGTITDTEQHHRLPGQGGKPGPYKPERADLHARIVRLLMQGAGSHSSPEAHFMAGGPASGKSRLLKDGKVSTPADAVDVNPDIVKTMLPEYQALLKRGDPLASSKVHEESSHVAKLLMNLSLDRGHHVVVDGTGNSGPAKFAAKIKAAQAAGHKTSVHYATVDTATAVERAAARGKKTGRNVPEGYIRSAHRDVSARFVEDIANMPGVHVRAFDTGGKKTRLLYEKGRHERAGKVHHKAGYDRFVGKAKESS